MAHILPKNGSHTGILSKEWLTHGHIPPGYVPQGGYTPPRVCTTGRLYTTQGMRDGHTPPGYERRAYTTRVCTTVRHTRVCTPSGTPGYSRDGPYTTRV